MNPAYADQITIDQYKKYEQEAARRFANFLIQQQLANQKALKESQSTKGH